MHSYKIIISRIFAFRRKKNNILGKIETPAHRMLAPSSPSIHFSCQPILGRGGGGGTIGLRRGRDCLTYLGRRGQNTHSRLCPILLDLSIHLPFFWTQTKSVNELKGRTPGTLDKLIGQIRARALNPRWSLSSPLC